MEPTILRFQFLREPFITLYGRGQLTFTLQLLHEHKIMFKTAKVNQTFKTVNQWLLRTMNNGVFVHLGTVMEAQTDGRRNK